MQNDVAAYEFTVTLDPEAVAHAMRRVMARRQRPSLPPFIAFGVLLGILLVLSPPAWKVWLLGVPLALLAVVLLLVLLQHSAVKQAARDYVELLENGELHHRVSPDVLWLGHPLSSSTIRWAMVRRVHKMKGMWVLAMRGNRSFTTLPLDQVPPEALMFIESQALAHGAEVDPDPS